MIVNRSRAPVAALVAVLALLLPACGGDDDDGQAALPASSSEPADEPRRGGELTFLHIIEATGFDPALLTSVKHTSDALQGSAIFDTLLNVDVASGQIRPNIAQSLESTDAKTWTLTLRPDVRFSDGTPYDAEAVKLNWERIADPATKSPHRGIVQIIESMTVVDPLTLRIALKEPNGQFPRLVAGRIPFIGSPRALQEKGAGFLPAPVGAGPFTVKEWVRDSHLTLVRNETYWDQPRPYLDAMTIRFVPDAAQRYNTFLASSRSYGTSSAGDLPMANRAERAGFQVFPVSMPGGGHTITFNMSRPPFDDIAARKAIAHAIDKEQASDVVTEGVADALMSMFSRPSPFAMPDLTFPGYDVAKAQSFVDEYVARRGGPIRFKLMVSPQTQLAGEQFQAQIARLRGVDMQLDVVASSEYLATMIQHNFDAVLVSVEGLDPEPDFFDHYFSGSQRNYGLYANPAMDAALLKGRTSLTEAERVAAYRQMQEIAIADVPEVWTITLSKVAFLFQSDVRDVQISAAGPLWSRMWLSA